MMRFAVIGGVHSNKFALKTVLMDLAERNVDFIVSTGDLVGYLPFSNEVIEMIRNNKVLVVKATMINILLSQTHYKMMKLVK